MTIYNRGRYQCSWKIATLPDGVEKVILCTAGGSSADRIPVICSRRPRTVITCQCVRTHCSPPPRRAGLSSRYRTTALSPLPAPTTTVRELPPPPHIQQAIFVPDTHTRTYIYIYKYTLTHVIRILRACALSTIIITVGCRIYLPSSRARAASAMRPVPFYRCRLATSNTSVFPDRPFSF